MPAIGEPEQPGVPLLEQHGIGPDGEAPAAVPAAGPAPDTVTLAGSSHLTSDVPFTVSAPADSRQTTPAGRRGTVSPFSIGDPGRAALELPAGLPGARLGHPDVELSAAAFAGMLVQGAACRGLQHRVTATARQDSFAIAHHRGASGTERAVAVVCDGVGSLGRSDEAAAFVSRRLASLGAEGVPWPEAFSRTNEAVRALAEQAAVGTSDPVADGMATTAVAVAVHREGADWVAEAAWVGDSPLWHLASAGRWELLSGSPEDEAETDYHSTGVRPLPSADGSCTCRDFRLSGGSLFIMSDGVGNPLRWSPDVQDALAGWWQAPPDPFTFAAQVSFARRTHIDDRTVIGIWPDAEPGPGNGKEDP